MGVHESQMGDVMDHSTWQHTQKLGLGADLVGIITDCPD